MVQFPHFRSQKPSVTLHLTDELVSLAFNTLKSSASLYSHAALLFILLMLATFSKQALPLVYPRGLLYSLLNIPDLPFISRCLSRYHLSF